MYCSKCGNKLDHDVNFCKYCGADCKCDYLMATTFDNYLA
jgi:zinc-ribbon domain